MIQHNGCAAHVIVGPVLENLRTMPDGLARMCVTSPPYFGLRDYGVDGQIGLEETPEQFIAALVEVFREVRRVLKDDGTLWVNIGDSYARSPTKGGSGPGGKNAPYSSGFAAAQASRRVSGAGVGQRAAVPEKRAGAGDDCKEKDLIGIPWMLAFALRADGWYLRSEIIWDKPNPMPESVTDRPTKAHEQIFLLAKSPKYFYDIEAIKEPTDPKNFRQDTKVRKTPPGQTAQGKLDASRGEVRYLSKNKRTVWRVSPRGYAGAHFATFPPDLIEPCILAGSAPGDMVLEPFSGSGTTAGVSLKHGRNCLAFELNPEYAALTPDRVASICR